MIINIPMIMTNAISNPIIPCPFNMLHSLYTMYILHVTCGLLIYIATISLSTLSPSPIVEVIDGKLSFEE